MLPWYKLWYVWVSAAVAVIGLAACGMCCWCASGKSTSGEDGDVSIGDLDEDLMGGTYVTLEDGHGYGYEEQGHEHEGGQGGYVMPGEDTVMIDGQVVHVN